MSISNPILLVLLFICLICLQGCENREIGSEQNSSSSYSFSDLPLEGIETHFQKIWLEDMEYFILERDRNNPHEGFGFMAFKGNVMVNKQDSLMAYLQTSLEVQSEILALLKRSSIPDEKELIDQKLANNLRNRQFLRK